MNNNADISVPMGNVETSDEKGKLSWKVVLIGFVSGLIGNFVSFLVPLGLEIEKKSYLIGAVIGSLLQIIIIVVLALVL